MPASAVYCDSGPTSSSIGARRRSSSSPRDGDEAGLEPVGSDVDGQDDVGPLRGIGRVVGGVDSSHGEANGSGARTANRGWVPFG